MPTTLTVKGRVTIPKPIRDAMGLTPGAAVDLAVNGEGQVELRKAARAGGKVDMKWRTKDLMALLRH